jgi:hypothetical protein
MRASLEAAAPAGSLGNQSGAENTEQISRSGTSAKLFAADKLEVALIPGLPVDELTRRLAVAARTGEACHRALAFYLHDMEARRAYQELGFASAVDFAQHRLHLSRGRARDLLLVGRKLNVLPGLDAAFLAGELSWSKVRRLARVATAQTEQAWIGRARAASHEELDALVGSAREGDEPKDIDRGLPRTRFVKRFVLDTLHLEMFERAREKLAAELARQVTDDDVFDEMLRLLLSSDADGSVRGRKKVEGSVFRVPVPTVTDTPQTPTPTPTSASTPPAPPSPVPTEADAIEAAASDAAVSGRLRRTVLARDDHCCTACTSRRSLMVHHIVWRSHGGATDLDNLVTLCARCHGLVHDRWLHVARGAGGTLSFTDRDGHRLHAPHPHVGSAVRITCAAAQMSGAAQSSEPCLLDVDDIPDVVDGEWWQKHEHLFDWAGGKLRLKRQATLRR